VDVGRLNAPRQSRAARCPRASLLDQNRCPRWALRQSTNSPATTNRYVVLWKMPSQSVSSSRFSIVFSGYQLLSMWLPLQELVQHDAVEKAAEPQPEEHARRLGKMPLLGVHQ